jgi:hypothetical protein
VELSVAQTVLQDNLVIIPKGAVLTAKITSVRHAGRPIKNGRVSFSVENAVLPGGEIAALRPEPSATAGQNLRGGVKAAGQMAVDPELPPGAGVVILALAGPVMLFTKGHERTLYAGRITTLYVHGPLNLKRDEVLKVQPPPYKGPAQVFYQNRAYTGETDTNRDFFYCGQMPFGKVLANQALQLQLNPGTYWLSAGYGGKEKLRLEVEADHRYYVERGAQGLFLKNFDDFPWLLDEDTPLRDRLDFTSASPEQTADLLAMPLSDDAAQTSH